MVAHRFCRVFREEDPSTPLIVIGKEREPAYDRVNLTSMMTKEAESLYLAPEGWYKENDILWVGGTEIINVDSKNRILKTRDGHFYSYGALILATGSTPWAPPIPGLDGQQVYLYRTMTDVRRIKTAAETRKTAVVIGGGLLGLEAARALADLELSVRVVEIADYLMPQQLDPEAGKTLKHLMEAQGIEVHTSCQTKEITTLEDGRKQLRFGDGSEHKCDMIVVSVGIRPCTAYLEDSGVQRSPNGSVLISEYCETNMSGVYAIGECAGYKGQTYGFVAPGYQMAEVVARYLNGRPKPFLPPQPSIRLKVSGIEVSTLGEYQQALLITNTHRWPEATSADCPNYRKLTFRKRRLIGAIVVGDFAELPRLQAAIAREQPFSKRQIKTFERTGDLFPPETGPAILSWDPETEVCNCMKVSKARLEAAMLAGATTVEALGQATFAGTVCGSCQPHLRDLLGAKPTETKVPVSAYIVIGASLLAFVAVTVIVFATPLSYATSVEAYWYKVDQLWRDGMLKQITGYSLFGLCAFAMALSVQKRFKKLKIGKYAAWRAIHTLTGLLSLMILFLHTGFHIGANFNAWLLLVFALLNLFGGLAGFFSGMAAKPNAKLYEFSRRWKPVFAWAHILTFWPIPLLTAFHILSVYYW